MARRTRFITVLISFLAFFVLTRARQRGRLAREPCESETTPSPLERGSRAPLAFSHIHRPAPRLVRAPSLYVLPVRSIRVWSDPWFNVRTGATGIFGSLHVVRNRSSLGNVARPQSCVPSSSVSKRGSSELACLEWLSGGLGCQTLPCLRFSGSLSERGRVGRRAWCACACISSFAASSPAAASRSLARGKPQTPATCCRLPSFHPRPMTAEGYESSLSISSLLFPPLPQPPHRIIHRINMGRA